jgi:glutamyl-tRNA synthetase
MNERRVRVRFAPSPTGPLHMGGVRTALYNYLFAKKHGGDFILRIEDTDQGRFVPGAEEYIIEALTWCRILPNEGQSFGGPHGPYKQSERKPMYKQYAMQLIESGHAYYAFDTSDELDEMREWMKNANVASPQYNAMIRSSMKNSLSLSEDEVKIRLERGDEYVIRFKMPRNEEIRVKDIIRGWVVVNSVQLDDKVLFKSDGMPTYHLANIVDDHLMDISHVIRGEEWLPSAPLHVMLYKAFGWEETMPQFAHLPLLLKPDGNGKLSKRDGDRLGFPVFPLDWKDPETGEHSSGYKQRGYYPEAFVNMLAFLGWNPGTPQEIFSLDELVQAFSLERVGKSGSKFDPEKSKWFNQHYLRHKPSEELAAEIMPELKKLGVFINDETAAKFCEIMKERASFITEILEGAFLFTAPVSYEEQVIQKKWKPETSAVLAELNNVFLSIEDFNAHNCEVAFKSFLVEKGIGLGEIMPILRVLLTGKGMGAGVFQLADLFGKEETIKRIEAGIKKLS